MSALLPLSNVVVDVNKERVEKKILTKTSEADFNANKKKFVTIITHKFVIFFLANMQIKKKDPNISPPSNFEYKLNLDITEIDNAKKIIIYMGENKVSPFNDWLERFSSNEAPYDDLKDFQSKISELAKGAKKALKKMLTEPSKKTPLSFSVSLKEHTVTVTICRKSEIINKLF